MARLKTLIIGLGHVGALYDIDAAPDTAPRTHLRALSQNKIFKIVGLVEPDENTRSRVKSHYTTFPETIYYSDVGALPSTTEVDVVVLTAPAHTRRDHISAALGLKPKLIVIEKPIALSLAEAHEIQNLCAAQNVSTIINFHRRYDTGHTTFKARLPAEEIPAKIICHYSKGLMNYGSHAIDLLTHWFGPAVKVQAITSNEDTDPLLDGVIFFENGVQAHLISHAEEYDLFDFEFFYRDSKYTLSHGGVEKSRQAAIPDRYYVGYTQLGTAEELLPTGTVHGLAELYEDIAQKATNPAHQLQGCTAGEAVKGLQIIACLIKSATEQKPITV